MPAVNGKATSGRFVFVDALRGVAALAVLGSHVIGSPNNPGLLKIISASTISCIVAAGQTGVDIFFVISGFVIAHSVRKLILSPRGVGAFILRRQLRLDPPYWAAMVLCFAVVALKHHRQGAMIPMPAPVDFLWNLLYVQRILGRFEIVGVAWTLCIELQFYLLFIIIMALGQRAMRGERPRNFSVALIFLTGIGSLAMNPAYSMGVTLLSYWCYFAGGVLCYWAILDRTSLWWIGAFSIIFSVSACLYGFPIRMVVAMGTIGALFIVGRRGKLGSLWGNRPAQYFGRVSYSLYLTHVPIVMLVLSVTGAATRTSGPLSIVYVLLAVSVSFAFAHLFYTLIEKPSLQLAHWLRQPRTASGQAANFASPERDQLTPPLAPLQPSGSFPAT